MGGNDLSQSYVAIAEVVLPTASRDLRHALGLEDGPHGFGGFHIAAHGITRSHPQHYLFDALRIAWVCQWMDVAAPDVLVLVGAARGGSEYAGTDISIGAVIAASG